MKINKKLKKIVGRKYMRLGAMYRRGLGKSCGLDFSEQALIECFEYESKGWGEPAYNNGFYAGKRFMDVTISDAIQDIKEGKTCKVEFYTPVGKSFWLPVLQNVVITRPFFAYE